jgi:PAS domain S-box-containing protein
MRRFTPSYPVRVSLVYLVAAGLWIIGSDHLLGYFVNDPALLTEWASLKGLGFVAVTAGLLYAALLAEERHRQRAEHQSRQLANIVRSSQDAIFSISPDGIITSWNLAAQRIYGYTAEEAEGSHVSMLAPPDRDGETAQLIAEIRADKTVLPFETVRRRKDGSPIDVSLSASPIRDMAGQVTGVSVIVHDIGERKAVDRRVQEQQVALRAYANRLIQVEEAERSRLSRELHDDTLQQLVALAQRVELCRNDVAREPAAAMRRLDELRDLARGLAVDLRRVSNDLRPLILEDLGLAPAVNSLCDELGRLMPECAVQCHTVGAARRLDPAIELATFRIIQQALSNVRAHAPGATRVDVTLEFERDAIRASVTDDGPGFAPRPVNELLRQGHLGLAGMQERAELLRGEVTIDSSPDTGTTVSLQLPVQDGATSGVESTPAPETP